MSLEPFQRGDSPYSLHLGDCLEFLPTLEAKSVDVILTDPPYSEHIHRNIRERDSLNDLGTANATGNRRREIDFEAITLEEIRAASREFARLAKRWVLVFSNIELCHVWREELVDAGLEYIRTGVWIKEDSPPQFSGDRPATGYETVTIAHPKGRKQWNGGGSRAVWKVPIAINRGGRTPRLHPTQKPLDLASLLVKLFSNPGETILDPYTGSGTFGVAALKQGRRVIACERKLVYHEIAQKCLEAAHQQPQLLEVAS